MLLMLRRTTAFAALLLLTACGGGGGETTSVNCDKEYWDGTVGICVPEGWGVIDQETLRQRGAPDDTIAAFQAEEAVSGQFPTVTVTVEPLVEEVSAEDYSEASIRSVSVLPGYVLVDDVPVSVDGASVHLHVFNAQPVADEPARRFYQISTTTKDKGYTVTATTPVTVEDALDEQVLFILQSTTFIDKAAAAVPVEE